jgi:hypothetical protein
MYMYMQAYEATQASALIRYGTLSGALLAEINRN